MQGLFLLFSKGRSGAPARHLAAQPGENDGRGRDPVEAQGILRQPVVAGLLADTSSHHPTSPSTEGKNGCHNAVEIMKALETYGAAAREIIPDLKQLIIDYKELRKDWVFPDSTIPAVEHAIKVIEEAKDHPQLRSSTSASTIFPLVATPPQG